MLIKLIPEQISAFWDIIKYGIEEAVPPFVGEQPDRMGRILASLLDGTMDCWISFRKESNDERIFQGLVITTTSIDEPTRTMNLLIYAVFGDNANKGAWEEGYQTLTKYAISRKYNSIIAYTQNDSIIKLAKHLGAELSTFLVFPLKPSVKN